MYEKNLLLETKIKRTKITPTQYVLAKQRTSTLHSGCKMHNYTLFHLTFYHNIDNSGDKKQ